MTCEIIDFKTLQSKPKITQFEAAKHIAEITKQRNKSEFKNRLERVVCVKNTATGTNGFAIVAHVRYAIYSDTGDYVDDLDEKFLDIATEQEIKSYLQSIEINCE